MAAFVSVIVHEAVDEKKDRHRLLIDVKFLISRKKGGGAPPFYPWSMLTYCLHNKIERLMLAYYKIKR